MNLPPSIVWFRLDLRLADNPALQAGIEGGAAVLPVFIYAPEEESPWAPGAASRWWLHQSLASLNASLRVLDSRLIIRRGPALESLLALVGETGAAAVFWNRRYEPAVLARDSEIKERLLSRGLAAESFNGALLHEPWTIRNQSGKPFQVFTRFWRNCLAQPDPVNSIAAPRKLAAPRQWPESLRLDALALEPRAKWGAEMRTAWSPGEVGALAQLRRFSQAAFLNYGADRDRPDRPGTSRLSPHLHFGEISPRQVWHYLRSRAASHSDAGSAVGRSDGAGERSANASDWRNSQFITEIGWREFAHHLLFHFPRTPTEPLRAGFSRFAWRADPALLKAWQVGRTGYPIVDAGMRELWATGWMHNRVRMIAASFLVKDLLVSWTEGARWFWDTLVDADLAQNTLGWQWTAGCGADAAPYFRIFNPISQGEKFDPRGDYVRRWCPELAKLPDRWLHRPWQSPPETLVAAGIDLGRNYPRPIVNHAIAREVALEAFSRLKAS